MEGQGEPSRNSKSVLGLMKNKMWRSLFYHQFYLICCGIISCFVWLPACLLVCLSFCLSVFLSVSLSVNIWVCLSAYLPGHQSVFFFFFFNFPLIYVCIFPDYLGGIRRDILVSAPKKGVKVVPYLIDSTFGFSWSKIVCQHWFYLFKRYLLRLYYWVWLFIVDRYDNLDTIKCTKTKRGKKNNLKTWCIT